MKYEIQNLLYWGAAFSINVIINWASFFIVVIQAASLKNPGLKINKSLIYYSCPASDEEYTGIKIDIDVDAEYVD